MTENGIVQLIALAACMILAGSGLASYRLGWKDSIRTALIWGGIFTGVALLFSLVMG